MPGPNAHVFHLHLEDPWVVNRSMELKHEHNEHMNSHEHGIRPLKDSGLCGNVPSPSSLVS